MKLTQIVEDLYQQMTGQVDDHEVEMAITDLRALSQMAGELAQHFENEKPKELEGWVQAKITKAADYIDAVHKNHVYSPDHECDTCGEESQIAEAKSTCCGKCGHKHVKGTACPKPFLTGKRHCRNRS
jgi:hypothetical protein